MLWTVLLLVMAWILSDPMRNSVDRYALSWVDPAPGSKRPAIDPTSWGFDYEKIEQELIKMGCGNPGLSELTEASESILRRAVESFPAQADDRVLQRIRFLAEKGCPSTGNLSVAQLLMQYYEYVQRLLVLHEEQRHAGNSLSDEEKFDQTVALRKQVFGEEVAHKLFGRQQAFAHYLFERQQILNDQTLTEAEKDSQLKRLQIRFKESSAVSDEPG